MDNEDRLWKIAEQQEGFFTAKQAAKAGYASSNFHRMVKSKKWVHEMHGIYRLAQFPLPERPELILWSLWSRNRAGVPQGVWSHETALEIYDISDVNPIKMHLSVPIGFRGNPPEFIVLHHQNLSELEIEKKKGYRITTPLRTLVDVFREGKLSRDLLTQSVQEMVKTGLIHIAQLQHTKKYYPEVKKILEELNA